MGQYYKPCNIETMEWVYSHSYDSGSKLMEHSYLGHKFVGAVMTLLSKDGKWYKKPIVWCGDYFKEEGEENYYAQTKKNKEIKPESMPEKEQLKCLIVNHTKKEYVILSKEDFIPATSKVKQARKMLKVIENEEDAEWVIHPLPLLTACGNGRGGGDYDGSEMDKIGYWARDIISVEKEIPEGYKELEVNFKEE